MNRRLPLLLFFALGGLFSTTFVGQEAIAGQEPLIRVLVRESTNLRFRSDGDTPLFVKGVFSKGEKLSSISLSRRSGYIEVRVRGDKRKVIRLNKDSVLWISSNDSRGIWLENRRYRGALRVRLIGKLFQVVNHVGIENYLASVVGGEMPKTWPIAALRAQAVAARTYALKRYGKRGNFDVKSNQSSQVYLGIESETKTTLNAAKSTNSLVLAHKGKLINAVFHSSSGGSTEPSGYVWKNQLPYLLSVKDYDQHSPNRKWEVLFDRKQLKKAFSDVGGLDRLDLINHSPTGRVRIVKASGPRGSISITGEELRRRLGLKSTLFRFEMIDLKTAKSINLTKKDSKQVNNIPINNVSTQVDQFYLQSTADKNYLDKNSLSQNLPLPPPLPEIYPVPPDFIELVTPPPPLNSFRKNSLNDKNSFLYVRGLGAGHGVGMSQWGAYGLAKKGFDFRQILNHYYTDVDIIPFSRVLEKY